MFWAHKISQFWGSFKFVIPWLACEHVGVAVIKMKYIFLFMSKPFFLNLHGWEKVRLIWLIWGKIRVCRQWEFKDIQNASIQVWIFVEGGDIFLTLGAFGSFGLISIFFPIKLSMRKCDHILKWITGCWKNNIIFFRLGGDCVLTSHRLLDQY